MGPYEVVIAFDNGSVEIKTIDGSQISFVVNGHRLKLYHQPISMIGFRAKCLAVEGYGTSWRGNYFSSS